MVSKRSILVVNRYVCHGRSGCYQTPMLHRCASHHATKCSAERGFGCISDREADVRNAIGGRLQAISGKSRPPACKIIKRCLSDDITEPPGKIVRDMPASLVSSAMVRRRAGSPCIVFIMRIRRGSASTLNQAVCIFLSVVLAALSEKARLTVLSMRMNKRRKGKCCSQNSAPPALIFHVSAWGV
jgi:hypothetical protein